MNLKLKAFGFVVFAMLLLTVSSCKKDKGDTYKYMNEAKIIGMDYRTCICCGGVEITIDNVSNPNGKNYYLTGNLPDDFTLANNEHFPVSIKLDWSVDTIHCFGSYINVTKIKRN